LCVLEAVDPILVSVSTAFEFIAECTKGRPTASKGGKAIGSGDGHALAKILSQYG
jgi:hypothetical protein